MTEMLESNAPCHCSSGRKYKKCCMDSDTREAAAGRLESARRALVRAEERVRNRRNAPDRSELPDPRQRAPEMPAAAIEPITPVEPLLREAGISHGRLDGSTSDRGAVVRFFQEGEVPVFLLSLKAGGTGLNLVGADTVIFLDPWWNPAAEAQAMGRAHRIGQTRPVFVYKLVARGRVEEKILALQECNAELAASILEGGGAATLRFDATDLADLMRPLD